MSYRRSAGFLLLPAVATALLTGTRVVCRALLPLATFSAALFTTALPICAQTAPGTIPVTDVFAAVDKTIDTRKAKPGDLFRARTIQGTTLNDMTVPIGSVLEGHVDFATPSEHKSDGELIVTIDKLHLKGGKEIPVKVTILHVVSLEREIGKDDSHNHLSDQNLNTGVRGSTPVNTGSDEPVRVEAAPHEVPGLNLASSVNDANSGTFTQAKGNVHLSNQNRIQVSVAVIPPGSNIK